MCYPESRVGDEIWVLYGGKVLIVLRQIHEHDQRIVVRITGHLFVGDCYLDEFMDGQAIRDGCFERQSILIQ